MCNKKIPRLAGLSFPKRNRGVEGSRTPVQTMLPLVFYMLIVLLFVGGRQEKHKPIYYLAGWYLNRMHSLLLSHPFLFWLS